MATAGCELNSCLNGGTCVAYSANERWCNPVQSGQTCCQCVTGFTGYRCETGNFGPSYLLIFLKEHNFLEINECVSNPCKNGGICENLVNSYRCSCPTGFTGTNCEGKLFCFKTISFFK